MIEFKEWPKIPRLFRECMITEKIDGMNAGVVIEKLPGNASLMSLWSDVKAIALVNYEGDLFMVGAQARNGLITLKDDSHGFAAWVGKNAPDLVRILGVGTHMGEWWGGGINRGYGLPKGEKYFSLFNVARWDPVYDEATWPAGLSIVPVLYEGMFSTVSVRVAVEKLKDGGSFARGGYDRPEGVVVYHTAAEEMFKVTCERDEEWKGKR